MFLFLFAFRNTPVVKEQHPTIKLRKKNPKNTEKTQCLLEQYIRLVLLCPHQGLKLMSPHKKAKTDTCGRKPIGWMRRVFGWFLLVGKIPYFSFFPIRSFFAADVVLFARNHMRMDRGARDTKGDLLFSF